MTVNLEENICQEHSKKALRLLKTPSLASPSHRAHAHQGGGSQGGKRGRGEDSKSYNVGTIVYKCVNIVYTMLTLLYKLMYTML